MKNINFCSGKIVQTHNLAIELGLQRVAIEKTELAETFNIRIIILYILLFANSASVQFN
ncbi:MAG: hypothetical protein ACTMUB_06510 [cyanobacterium endosymbiont of Rhopalodia musculus]|uniref:hypothetical protein n=1 Tax=cyanobacterium endosymbiont of Epithemia clementina EcSB TaxID=3034674 RepID=UPI00248094B6|nr:hypothetical protein [cyanobacterium endosymbiont of Epithemia clementina EcSB]WGT67773.1 hypothetical protein P3F56_01350 [cyanobacterium endosymbiont of Epithemia clementina EcSB]